MSFINRQNEGHVLSQIFAGTENLMKTGSRPIRLYVFVRETIGSADH